MRISEHQPGPLTRRLLRMAGEFVRRVAIPPTWVDVAHLDLPVRDLPAAWDGAVIAHLSDLHAGRFVSPEYLRKVVELTNAQKPDLIVLTGDHFSRTGHAQRHADVLRDLRAPAGKFAVFGNHDYDIGPAPVRRLLASAGIELLRDRAAVLERDGGRLCLAGVDDFWHHPAPLGTLLAGVPADVPRIVLCHNPDYAETIPPGVRADLLLAGHTHGGQIRLPFLPPPMVQVRHRKFTAGLTRCRACPVYVSRGIGVVGLPLRLFCPAELPVITIRRERRG